MSTLSIEQLKDAWKAGKRIQMWDWGSRSGWVDLPNPHFVYTSDVYRINPADVVNPHPHAALMMKYAIEAATNSECWKNWESSYKSEGNWQPCIMIPAWNVNRDYRRKIKTIRIGDRDVPAPLTSSNGITGNVFLADTLHPCKYLVSSTHNVTALKRGMLHTTAEAAIAHSEALIAISGGIN